MNAVPDSLGISAVDEQTLELQVTAPNPPLLDVITYSAFAPVPEGYVDDVPGYDGEVTVDEISRQEANGTGPFLFDSFTENEEATVVRNDDYWGETANVEEIRWAIFSDPQAEYDYSVREENADILASRPSSTARTRSPPPRTTAGATSEPTSSRTVPRPRSTTSVCRS
jgi:ABC-type oligopeptide transport system, periplasmic component